METCFQCTNGSAVPARKEVNGWTARVAILLTFIFCVKISKKSLTKTLVQEPHNRFPDKSVGPGFLLYFLTMIPIEISEECLLVTFSKIT